LSQREDLSLCGITSESSIQLPEQTESRVLPWSTRGSMWRVLTDHLYPLIDIGHDFPVDKATQLGTPQPMAFAHAGGFRAE
jgi:hypothetical protein